MKKELEALERIVDTYYIDNMDEEISVIETTLKDYERVMVEKNDLFKRWTKEHQVLEIIKEKEVNIHYFKNACATMSYEQYFSMWNAGCFIGIQMTSKIMLTEEEFNSLKEALL